MTSKPKASPLRAYIDDLDDLPADCLLGRIVLFTITEEKVKRDDLVRWFAELDLDEKLLPMENKAVDAFKKATSDTKDTYPMSKERTAYALCRDVTSNGDYIRRQITREIKNAAKKQLSYDELISVTFYRALRADDQGSARLTVTPNPTWSASEEWPYIKQIAADIYARYESYLQYLDSQKVRAMVRGYLKKLNAIEIKGGVYFVHASRDDELSRLSELVDRLGGGCQMHQIPMLDLQRERAFIVRTFEREAAQTLNDVTKEIEEIAAGRTTVTPSTYARLKAKFDEVMANAEEHMLTLEISQDSTEAAAEIALKALTGLADRMVSE